MRSLYVIQPYEVGSKKAKSLALVIPAKVVKKYNITISTVFVLKANTQTKTIVLEQTIYPVNIEPQGIEKPTGESLHATNQQAESSMEVVNFSYEL